MIKAVCFTIHAFSPSSVSSSSCASCPSKFKLHHHHEPLVDRNSDRNSDHDSLSQATQIPRLIVCLPSTFQIEMKRVHRRHRPIRWESAPKLSKEFNKVFISPRDAACEVPVHRRPSQPPHCPAASSRSRAPSTAANEASGASYKRYRTLSLDTSNQRWEQCAMK